MQKSGCSKLNKTKVTKLPDVCKYHYKIDHTFHLQTWQGPWKCRPSSLLMGALHSVCFVLWMCITTKHKSDMKKIGPKGKTGRDKKKSTCVMETSCCGTECTVLGEGKNYN